MLPSNEPSDMRPISCTVPVGLVESMDNLAHRMGASRATLAMMWMSAVLLSGPGTMARGRRRAEARCLLGPQPQRTISLTVPPNLVSELDRVASEYSWSRSRLMRELLIGAAFTQDECRAALAAVAVDVEQAIAAAKAPKPAPKRRPQLTFTRRRKSNKGKRKRWR